MQIIHVVCSYTVGVPAALPSALVPQIKSYLSTSDIPLLSLALALLALLFELAPTTTFPEVESDLLPDVYRIAHVFGATLDSLRSFCATLVSADNQIATHLVPNLVIAVRRPRARMRVPATSPRPSRRSCALSKPSLRAPSRSTPRTSRQVVSQPFRIR
jgi:cullin-associated NEDD8-dissociated protein 1